MDMQAPDRFDARVQIITESFALHHYSFEFLKKLK